ncbi:MULTISPECIES: MarR family transcriptional regulator [Staphylococcus]|uniref:MarR family transcriptional regulator n=1 Tax=Staphylococcus hsinchuensis TaxID=3051183 RepID=A0ABZ3EA81_9STAP|nr:MarR family transcriptional regulator [Staphylococcus sp. Marseille-Q6910]
MYTQLEILLTQISNDLNVVSKRYGQRANLTSEQIEMLRILYHNKILTQYDLTMQLNKEQSIVSRWVKKLCHLGYIQSKQSNTDLRCKELVLTEKANRLVEQIYETRITLIKGRCTSMTSIDVELLNQLLYKLNNQKTYIS